MPKQIRGRIINTIDEPKISLSASSKKIALFESGFRTFFFLGSAFAVFAVLYFILSLSGIVPIFLASEDIFAWHRHEMLFGFTGAIIVGFLFTAVPNWTGYPTPKNMHLAVIAALWLIARITTVMSVYFPAIFIGSIDVSFFLICAAGIFPALFKSKNRRNYFFVALLILLAIANLLTHLGYENIGIMLARNIIILIMVLIGSRVIPFFTERPLGLSIPRNPYIERFAIVSTILALTVEVLGMKGSYMGIFYLLAMIANGWRVSRWKSIKTYREPMLWILHAGYIWLVIGFAMKTVYYLGLGIPSSIAIHASTAGGISVLIIGMMSRVSLGHSGRAIKASKPMVVSFVCINIAAILRVFGVWLFPNFTLKLLEAASVLWLSAFFIFLVMYAPILIFSDKYKVRKITE